MVRQHCVGCHHADRAINNQTRRTTIFFSSGLADVALRLGPNMSISKTEIQPVPKWPHAKWQIKNKPETPTTKPRRPANPPARFAFRQKNSKPDKERGKSPNTNAHRRRFARDTAVKSYCVIYKSMQKSQTNKLNKLSPPKWVRLAIARCQQHQHPISPSVLQNI